MRTHWPENEVHRLRELIAAAFSAHAAAAKLSQETGRTFTRDMVSSKARALGLTMTGARGRPRNDPDAQRSAWEQFTGAGARTSRNSPTAKPAETGREHRGRSSGFALKPIPLPVHELRTIPARGVVASILARAEGCCAWPVSDWLEEGTARTPFCCAPVEPGRPYCPDHAAIAFQPAAVA